MAVLTITSFPAHEVRRPGFGDQFNRPMPPLLTTVPAVTLGQLTVQQRVSARLDIHPKVCWEVRV